MQAVRTAAGGFGVPLATPKPVEQRASQLDGGSFGVELDAP